ncbi:hypothetical protein [Mangrovihabitans endophyticus]|uniref:Uncharacterized protein n=1 Tax=Mangrovihabitans endophyticus TaxID=1751298 RepID=A0A8J3FPI9_9ACTN|nr:hypothetical protein [Mangrovihabitans endophyticus]GGK95682.1 hypothetical protein GCM10012284_32300 [Mangrovihabitans endophyticus]
MNSVLALLDGNGGQVAGIWLVLIILALLAIGGLALPSGVRRPQQVSEWLAESARRKRDDADRLVAEAAEATRYAEEIAVAVRGAAATAERRREDCQQAQGRVDAAWTAYQAADGKLDRARRAAAYAAPVSIPTEQERAESLRRSAQAAHRRGDLSDEQLMQALTHQAGWDPALHPVEQELVLARAAAAHRFRLYQEALEDENESWRASDIATAAVRSLRKEATTAETLAEAARAALPEQERAASGRRRLPAHA